MLRQRVSECAVDRLAEEEERGSRLHGGGGGETPKEDVMDLLEVSDRRLGMLVAEVSVSQLVPFFFVQTQEKNPGSFFFFGGLPGSIFFSFFSHFRSIFAPCLLRFCSVFVPLLFHLLPLCIACVD